MTERETTRPVLASEVEAWQSSVGSKRVQQAAADVDVLRRFALAAGIDAEVERQAPLLSHWALFFDAVADERIGPDGHPARGDFLPAVHLPRRMFASADLEFESPVAPGQTATCVSTITSVDHKRGSSGDLVFVKVAREVSQGDRVCAKEVQTLVYRPAGAPTPIVRDNGHTPAGGEVWTPGPVQLFRFSAVTFNAHRIHYDLPYARDEEGYPGLVVHGPFTAAKLLDFACRTLGRPARCFAFRGVAPVFASQPVYLAPGEEPGSFTATRCDGVVAMTAEVG